MKASITIKHLILLIFLIITGYNNSCNAINAKGYIITNKGDTVQGIIQLSRFDQVTGGLVLNGIEEESFHSRVVFKAVENKKFITYFPEMILGFGFKYLSTNYIYRSILVQRKSIIKSEQQQCRFVRLIYGENDEHLYKDVRFTPNTGLDCNNDKYLKYNSYRFRVKQNLKIPAEKADSLKNI